MVTIEEMKKAARHQVRVTLTSGIISEGFCTEYLWPEPGEDEHHNITVNEGGVLYEINDYEIESIEILD
ncbi:hypothetical protein [Peptococcus niger]|uniref:Uncharacterized protein n=1 Tax=Peptococcus niger TaxID=2741 RepID=A0A1G6RN80_PEPNI|nr:hypothetical protein [Peptococcus niger]SDD06089.1 hypothetical protein SAMN04489866_10174 [Peptococcus niger]